MNTALSVIGNVLAFEGWDVSVIFAGEIPEPLANDFLYCVKYPDVIFRGAKFSKANTKGRSSGRPAKDVDAHLADVIKACGLLRSSKHVWNHNGKEYISWRNGTSTVILDMEHDPRYPVKGKPSHFAGTVHLNVFKGHPSHISKRFRSALALAAINAPNNRGTVNPTEAYRNAAKNSPTTRGLIPIDPDLAPNDEPGPKEDAETLGDEISNEALQVILMMRQGYGSIKIN